MLSYTNGAMRASEPYYSLWGLSRKGTILFLYGNYTVKISIASILTFGEIKYYRIVFVIPYHL